MGYTKIKMWFNIEKWKAFWTHQTYPIQIEQLFAYIAQPLYVAFFGGGGRKVSTQEVSQHLVFKEMDSNRFSLLTRL
jgi:hypothetical protein